MPWFSTGLYKVVLDESAYPYDDLQNAFFSSICVNYARANFFCVANDVSFYVRVLGYFTNRVKNLQALCFYTVTYIFERNCIFIERRICTRVQRNNVRQKYESSSKI